MSESQPIHRIEVGILEDANLKASIQEDLGISTPKNVNIIKVYTIEGGNLSTEQLDFLGREVFSDPVTEHYTVDAPFAKQFPGYLVEISFKPGVTDNVGRTAKEAINDAIQQEVEGVYFSSQYLIYNVQEPEIQRITRELLANALIENWEIHNGEIYTGILANVPKVILNTKPTVKNYDLNLSDEDLIQFSKEKILALNLEEMKAIRNHFQQTEEERLKLGLPSSPTDVELECLAQTWSEHCCHKIFNAKIEYSDHEHTETIDSLFKSCIKKATDEINSDYLVSVFKDNAGVIQFTDDYTFAMKVETHNSPTALDPYGGALTGIVGCNRDPAGTGKGFKLIFNTDVFCFASPFYEGQIPPRLFHPRRVLKGVHKGVIDGGNQSGIPTVNGSLYFDDRYLGKPLVFVGTGAIAPSKIHGKLTHEKTALPGDLIVMSGGRIGADGIHGATFSSLEINEHSPATAVQIGAPIVQKNMLDFLLEARDLDLFNAITDNGAGGLSSSVGEMGETIGARLDLEKAPLKYPGLMPWEILVSEAQERMTIAVPPHKLQEFMDLSDRYDVESTVVGSFNESHHFQLYFNGKLVGNLAMEFLHDGVPQKQMIGKWSPPLIPKPHWEIPQNYTETLKHLLGRLNICSMEEAIVRAYDHEVQGASIIKPFMGIANDGPSDAAVIKPLFDKWEGLAISHGICPRFSDIDTYHMVANTIDEAIRNAVCAGANPDYMAGLDNFCWAMGYSKEDEIKYTGDLVRANKALYDYTTAFGVPCISGKDSMRNDYKIGNTKVSVPPTLLYSLVGKVPDVRKAISMDVKQSGDLVYVLGLTHNELGASEYFDDLKLQSNQVPTVDAPSALKRYRNLFSAIQKGIIASCHDCSTGGLAVALAESAFAGGLGLQIDLSKLPHSLTGEDLRNDILLFSESASRIIVTIHPTHKSEFEAIFHDSDSALIGVVRDRKLEIQGHSGEMIISEPISQLKEAWQKTMEPLGGGI